MEKEEPGWLKLAAVSRMACFHESVDYVCTNVPRNEVWDVLWGVLKELWVRHQIFT